MYAYLFDATLQFSFLIRRNFDASWYTAAAVDDAQQVHLWWNEMKSLQLFYVECTSINSV